MRRSLVTLATIDAAAIAALFSSPSTTAVCSGADEPRRKPSTRHASAGGVSAWSIARRPARFERCRPLRSISPGGITRTATRSARPDTVVAQGAVFEKHARHDEGPGQRAVACLVRSGDETRTEASIETEKP